MAWSEGDQIGQYRIISQLGQGGMATVYKAYHAQLDRYVAIKVMHQTIQADESFVARFRREAQIVASLTHPHIVPVYDFSEADGQPYLVMKYIEGVTLKQRMIQTAMSVQDILYIMRAIGSALTYAHSRGILHRDVKPSNVVIDSDNVPYLTDFGLARMTQAGESTLSADMLLGTPNYMSPEQASGKKVLDGRTDIYSLGIMLYELLVGHVPFSGDTPYAVIHAHIYTPLPSPSLINPEIPLSVEAVLIKATAKKPEDRYATADEMIRELEDAIQEADLTDLNPERVSIASTSLARLREHAEKSLPDGAGTLGLSEAAPARSSPFRTASLKPGYQTATLYEPQPSGGRFWMVGGCAGFLVIFFISLAVLLSASNNLLELSEILQRVDSDDLSVSVRPISSPLAGDLIVDLDGAVPVYVVPPMPLAAAQALVAAEPENDISYLTLAAAVWADDPTAAYTAIQQGHDHTSDATAYFLSAAQAADQALDYEAAIGYMLLAIHESQFDPDYQSALREAGGEYLYQTTPKVATLSLTSIYTRLGLNEMYSPAERSAISSMTPALIVTAYNRLLSGSPLQALAALNHIPEAETSSPEVQLIMAQLALTRRTDSAGARSILESLEDNDAAPDWIRERADDLLKEHNLQ